MRLTPLDLQQQIFSSSFRGYSREDVDAFLNKVRLEYESLYAENRRIKEENVRLTAKIQDYQEAEKTLKQTLVSAQKTSGELKNHAEKESQLIIREAELNAEKIIEEARSEARDLINKIKQLKKQKKQISSELRAMLKAYLEAIDSAEAEEKKPRPAPLLPHEKKG